MSNHINARKSKIAPGVIITGCPKRARFIARTYLKDYKRVSNVRNMWAYTGTYRRKKITVIGIGMGQPSVSIYVNELIEEYGVKKVIRAGTAGSLQEDVRLGDIVIAQGCCHDSNMHRSTFQWDTFAPLPDPDLYERASILARRKKKITCHRGNIFATDSFYKKEQPEDWKRWQMFGVKAVEMETAELYTLGAREKIPALTIVTISDLLYDFQQKLSHREKETALGSMFELVLATI